MALLTVERIISPFLETNAYVVADAAGGAALAVDPALVGRRIEALCRERGWRLEGIALTHGHIDHTHDAALLARLTGARVMAHALAAPLLSDPVRSGAAWLGVELDPCDVGRLLADGDTIKVGSAQLRVVHTPGHSAGCICLLGDEDCLTGDVLFRDGVGRWDLPEGDEAALARSLRRLAQECGAAVRLHPGHGEPTTMGRERRENPFLRQWL